MPISLERFGTTDPNAGEIERLCNCQQPKTITASELIAIAEGEATPPKHSEHCRSHQCTDGYPHCGDPCVVCESTPEEWKEYLENGFTGDNCPRRFPASSPPAP